MLKENLGNCSTLNNTNEEEGTPTVQRKSL